MKKCSNCSKDLPEAALHCVFCGAKQAAAPAVQPGLAKTAFGYSANEVMQQLGNQAPSTPAAPAAPRPQGGSQPPPMAGAPYQPPRPQGGSQPPPMGGAPYQPPGGGYPQGGLAPSAGAHAPTMMAAPGGAPYTPPAPAPAPAAPPYGGGPAYGQPAPQAPQPYSAPQGYPAGTGPMGGGYAPPQPQGPAGMGIHSPQLATPQPLPVAPAPPYLASRTAARAGRPIEPWQQSLKLMMFIWGAVALATFAIPLSTDPMAFNWDAILHAPGSAKMPALIWAVVGLLSIVFGAIPMPTLPRGLLATVLGLAGIVVPLVLVGHFGDRWQQVIQLVGAVCLIPGLLVRNEYTESLLARLLVTIGVILSLVPYLVPDHGNIPLVMLVKALIDAGNHMEFVILGIAEFVLLVCCLLVWMPGPATAGAKIFAWAVILFPVLQLLLVIAGEGHIDTLVSKTPGELFTWAPGVVYSILLGYGAATVIGKQLE